MPLAALGAEKTRVFRHLVPLDYEAEGWVNLI